LNYLEDKEMLKKLLVIGIAFVMISMGFVVLSGTVGAAATLYVDDDWQIGSPPYAEDTDADNDYATIQAAIDAASSGDTINIASGNYMEQLNIDISVYLIGAGQGSTIIESPDSLTDSFTTSGVNYPIVYIHDISGVTLQDLTIDGLGKGNANYRFVGIGYNNGGGTIQDVSVINIENTPFSGWQHGVCVLSSNTDGTDRNINIYDSYFDNFQKNAMALTGANTVADVQRNIIQGHGTTTITAQNGIQISGGAKGTVIGNKVYDVEWIWDGVQPQYTASGILIWGASAIDKIADNVVYGAQTGLYVVFTDDIVITGNKFKSSGSADPDVFQYGIILYGSSGNIMFDNIVEEFNVLGLYLYYSDDINIHHNIIDDNNFYGILIEGSDYNNVHHNKMNLNDIGVQLENSDWNNIHNNVITAVSSDVVVSGTSSNNEIHKNDFVKFGKYFD
jgi:parallel beta-helix repeat protein